LLSFQGGRHCRRDCSFITWKQ